MSEFSFLIRGPILAWMRPAQSGKSRYDPPEQVAYKKMVAWECKRAMVAAGLRAPMKGPVSLGVAVFYPHATRHNDDPSFKTTVPDFDNIVKNIKDALKNIAWIDDSQVAHYKEGGKFYMAGGPAGGVAAVMVTDANAPNVNVPAYYLNGLYP